MTAFADSFKAEIARIVRKEGKGDLANARKSLATCRSEISALKKEVKALSSQLKSLAKLVERSVVQESTAADEPAKRGGGRKFVFRPEALLAKRESLGITRAEMAALLEASMQSLAKWEAGKSTPRAAQLQRIRSVLGLGVREVRVRLTAEAGEAEQGQ